MTLAADAVEAIAARILAASDAVASTAPISDAIPDFDLADAYRVANAVARLRLARGERPIGWKIGFTNETIWDEYGVHAPIWGPMYGTTAGPDTYGTLSLATLVEPRIEPEIAFRIATPPDPDMDERALLECVDGIAHGFEIVQSLFPAWRFKAADTVAAFALHGRYRHGPFAGIAPADYADWQKALSDFSIVLICDGSEIDRGVGRNVLGGGPLTALRHFVRGLAATEPDTTLRAGDIVTTGTVTRAFPVKPGETWSTRLEGLPLPGMKLALA